MFTKELLYSLYVESNLTTYDIANKFSCHKKTVSRYLAKYNIPINSCNRKFYKNKQQKLTDIQRQILVGTLLGDGCLSKHGNYSRLLVGHCEKQYDLLYFKFNIFNNLTSKILKKLDKRHNSIMYSFSTITHQELDFYYSLFYKNGAKTIGDIYNEFTELSLAIWIMDDGSLNKTNLRISTDSFTYKDNCYLKDLLIRKFDIYCDIKNYTRNNSQYYYLSFNKVNTIKTSLLVQKFFIESMKYKLFTK